MGKDGFHGVEFLRAYVLKVKDYKYLTTPKPDDYLSLRQRGTLEGMAENLYRLNNFKPAANTSYGRTGSYDLASKLGLYNPITSVTTDLYSPQRKPYQKEKDDYVVQNSY